MFKLERCFTMAKNASSFSDFPKIKIGAVIICKNKVLSVGWNVRKETPMQKKFNEYRNFDPEKNLNSAHAEMIALDRLIKSQIEVDYSKCSIFIYREHKNGDLALARPCPACEAALRSIGIRDIYYTGNNSYIHEKYLTEESKKEIIENEKNETD